MVTPPYLVEADGEYRLDVAVIDGGRAQFALSDRAMGLLVDDLAYGNRDVVPWLVARTLVLARGAVPRDGRSDPRATSWTIGGADGGRTATDAELERLGTYLERTEVDDHAVDTVRELVRSTRLSEVVAPESVTGTRARSQGLRDLAKDL